MGSIPTSDMRFGNSASNRGACTYLCSVGMGRAVAVEDAGPWRGAECNDIGLFRCARCIPGSLSPKKAYATLHEEAGYVVHAYQAMMRKLGSMS